MNRGGRRSISRGKQWWQTLRLSDVWSLRIPVDSQTASSDTSEHLTIDVDVHWLQVSEESIHLDARLRHRPRPVIPRTWRGSCLRGGLAGQSMRCSSPTRYPVDGGLASSCHHSDSPPTLSRLWSGLSRRTKFSMTLGLAARRHHPRAAVGGDGIDRRAARRTQAIFPRARWRRLRSSPLCVSHPPAGVSSRPQRKSYSNGSPTIRSARGGICLALSAVSERYGPRQRAPQRSLRRLGRGTTTPCPPTLVAILGASGCCLPSTRPPRLPPLRSSRPRRRWLGLAQAVRWSPPHYPTAAPFSVW